MTEQEQIDYRVGVLKRVGVRVPDGAGWWRDIQASDLEISAPKQNIWIVVAERLNDNSIIKGVFWDENAACEFADQLNKAQPYGGEDLCEDLHIVELHEVRL